MELSVAWNVYPLQPLHPDTVSVMESAEAGWAKAATINNVAAAIT
jgi:hypothetical protein